MDTNTAANSSRRARPGLVHVVEDNARARETTARLLEEAGHAVRTYANASEFLAARPLHGCVVLDLPVADIAGAVEALSRLTDGSMRPNGVACGPSRAEPRAGSPGRRALHDRYARLTPREREVFAHLVSGQLNKQVAFDLGISVQTTKIHRRRVLEKMEAASIVQLARMAADLGVAARGSRTPASD
jgi:FixJ family two-component response regulator